MAQTEPQRSLTWPQPRPGKSILIHLKFYFGCCCSFSLGLFWALGWWSRHVDTMKDSFIFFVVILDNKMFCTECCYENCFQQNAVMKTNKTMLQKYTAETRMKKINEFN